MWGVKYINVHNKYENIGKVILYSNSYTYKNIDISNAKEKPIISYNKLNTPALINPSWESVYGGSGDSSVGKALARHA